jgi:PKD repeat protein
VYVTNLSTGGYSYSWDWGDSTYSKLKSPTYHAYKFGGTRKICLTVWDSLAKCSTTFCITVQVVKTRSSQQYGSGTAGNNAMQVYPNPADQTTTISWNGNYNILSVY